MLTRWTLYIIETVSWFIVAPVSISSMNIIYVIRWHISAVVWPVQNCDLIAWLEEITAKRIFTRFQLWAHKLSVKWVLGLRQSQFGSLAIASSPHSPSLEGRMRAAMGATGECHMRQCNIFDLYSFLSVTSSIVVSYTYHFTVDDDHIQNGQQYWVQWYAFKQVTSGYDINRSFVWKFDHEIIWEFVVILKGPRRDQAYACNKFYIVCSAFLRRLSKCYLICYKDEPWHLTHWGRVTHICVIKLNHHWFR